MLVVDRRRLRTAPLIRRLPAALHGAGRPSAAAASRPERRYDVDLIRVLATLAVIVLHTSHLVDKVTPGHTSSGHYITLVADAAGRFAVPAFFALAGWAVLVASPPRDGATVGRRLVRIVVPMAVWTAGYIAFVHLNGWYASTPPKTFAVNAIFGQILPAYHLWYLYAYIPLILLLSIAALVRAGVKPIIPAAIAVLVAVAAASGPAIHGLTGATLPQVRLGAGVLPVGVRRRWCGSTGPAARTDAVACGGWSRSQAWPERWCGSRRSSRRRRTAYP